MVRFTGCFNRVAMLIHSRFWLLLFLLVTTLCARAATQTYVVKPGDSVYTIARKFGVSTKALADRNGLSHNQHIYPGQRLAIPGASVASKSKKPTVAPLPDAVRRSIQNAKVRSGRWQYIVIHHSAVDVGDVASMERYHRDVRHMENGLAYHFVIGNGNGMGDGEIGVGRRWSEQLDGGHLASESMNQRALGICLVGNFDERLPSRRQMESLQSLVKALMTRCRLSASAVKSHQEINIVKTRCPGSRFPMESFVKTLR